MTQLLDKGVFAFRGVATVAMVFYSLSAHVRNTTKNKNITKRNVNLCICLVKMVMMMAVPIHSMYICMSSLLPVKLLHKKVQNLRKHAIKGKSQKETK